MTCIVGIETENNVLLASDSIATDNFTKSIIDRPKLFKRNDILFGHVGSFRFSDILEFNINYPENINNFPPREFLVRLVIPIIKESLKFAGFSKISNNTETGGTAFLAYRNQLFTMQEDFSILRYTRRYGSIGAGCYHAMGSLFTTAKYSQMLTDEKELAEFRAKAALESSIEFVTSVAAPFHFQWLND